MEQLRTEAPIHLPGMTLVPVSLSNIRGNNVNGYSASKVPIAIIICDNNGVHAMGMQASDIELSELIEKLPELETTLEELNCSIRSR